MVWNSDGTGGDIYIPKLRSTTYKVAPDHKKKKGGGKSRVQIGAGENVEVRVEWTPESSTPEHADWQQSGDLDGIDATEHNLINDFHAKKPSGEDGSGKITVDVTTDWGNVQLEKEFSVLKPSEVKTRRTAKWPIDIGTVGAGMDLQIQVKPTNVSFNDIFTREKGGAGTPEGAPHDVTDFFQYWLSLEPGVLDHEPEVEWVQPDEDKNEWADQAWLLPDHWPPPAGTTRSGSYHWEIPLVWDLVETENGGDEFIKVNQDISISQSGTLTIKKREAQVSRGINQTDGN